MNAVNILEGIHENYLRQNKILGITNYVTVDPVILSSYRQSLVIGNYAFLAKLSVDSKINWKRVR